MVVFFLFFFLGGGLLFFDTANAIKVLLEFHPFVLFLVNLTPLQGHSSILKVVLLG